MAGAETVTATRGGEDSARRLLAAAEKLVLRDGAGVVTLRRIAAQSGLNSALVSYYFGGLDGLVQRLCNENLDRIVATRSAQLGQALQQREPEARLDGVILAYVDPLWLTPATRNPQPARAVVRELLGVLKPDARAEVVGKINASVAEVAAAITPLLPHLPPDTIVMRLRLLAGAVELMHPRIDMLGLYPLQKRREETPVQELREQLLSFARGALLAA